MKKKILNFILSSFILPCVLLISACGGKNVTELEGKTVVFDRVEDLYWEGDVILFLKTIDDVEYEASLTATEAIEKFWNSEPFARALGRSTNFTTLQEAKTALTTKVIELYKEEYRSYKFSNDGTTVNVYEYSDTRFDTPTGIYPVTKRNTEHGYAYEITVPQDMGGVTIMLSEPDYIRCSGMISGKSLFLTGFVNETITMRNASGGTKEVKLSDFNDNNEGGFQFTFIPDRNNYYKVLD